MGQWGCMNMQQERSNLAKRRLWPEHGAVFQCKPKHKWTDPRFVLRTKPPRSVSQSCRAHRVSDRPTQGEPEHKTGDSSQIHKTISDGTTVLVLNRSFDEGINNSSEYFLGLRNACHYLLGLSQRPPVPCHIKPSPVRPRGW